MKETKVELKRVDGKSFEKVLELKVFPEQESFVAPNVESLAEAWLCYKEAFPYAVFSGNEIVGFLMLSLDKEERTASLWRLMIAQEYQHKGFGKAAVCEAMGIIKSKGFCDVVFVDYVPENEVAKKIYYSLGFRENGKMEDGEYIMELRLTDKPKLGILVADGEDLEEIWELGKQLTESALARLCRNKAELEQAIENGKVYRFALYGETVGIATDFGIAFLSSHVDRLDEGKQLLQGKIKSLK